MKRSKKIMALLCAVLSIAFMCAPFLTFAQVRTGEGEATLLQEGEFDIAMGESAHFGTTPSVADTVKENVHQGLLALSNRIDVSTLKCSVDEFDAFYSNVINDNPDLFYVSSSYRYYYNQSTNKVTAVIPQYAMSSSEITAAQAIFNAGAAKALSEVDASMSDLQKALTIHDYICSYAIYPTIYDDSGNYVEAWDKDIYHSAYGFFKDYNAVCAGYSLTYSYLMHQLGIDCEYASSNDMEHAWNKIKIDGNWYNVDITYDNSDFVDAENTYGLAYHTCFLKSDAYFQSESGLCHYDYMDYDGCTASDTKYDEAFWDDVNSRIYSIGGNYYYLNPNYTAQSVTLTKRTPAGSETTLGSALRAPTFSITRYAYDSSDTLHQVAHRDILTRLLYLDGKFYANDNANIYALSLTGSRQTAFSGTGYLISLGSIDGNLAYQTYNDMSMVVIKDKREYFQNNLTSYHVYPDTNNDGFVNGRDWAYIVNS